MRDEVEKSINQEVREAYEPLYGRRLSDEEVYEIRTNLTGFLEVLLEGVRSLSLDGGIDRMPEEENRV